MIIFHQNPQPSHQGPFIFYSEVSSLSVSPLDPGLEGPLFLLLRPFLRVCGDGNLPNIISLLACLI